MIITKATISIVIATYKRSDLIKKCLESIEKQTYTAREVIVVNNNGDEDTGRIIREYFPKCTVLDQKINLGVAEGRNVGIRAASGDYCLILDDDAQLREIDALEKIKVYFDNNPKLACIHFRVYDGYTQKIDRKLIPRRDRKIFDYDTECAFFAATGAAFRKSAFIEVGEFWKKLDLYFGEEPELSFRLMDNGYTLLNSSRISINHYSKNNRQKIKRRIYHGTRNTPWLAMRNLPWHCVLSLTILAWGYFGLQSIAYFAPWTFIQGVLHSFQGMPGILQQRKCISDQTIQKLKAHSGLYLY